MRPFKLSQSDLVENAVVAISRGQPPPEVVPLRIAVPRKVLYVEKLLRSAKNEYLHPTPGARLHSTSRTSLIRGVGKKHAKNKTPRRRLNPVPSAPEVAVLPSLPRVENGGNSTLDPGTKGDPVIRKAFTPSAVE